MPIDTSSITVEVRIFLFMTMSAILLVMSGLVTGGQSCRCREAGPQGTRSHGSREVCTGARSIARRRPSCCSGSDLPEFREPLVQDPPGARGHKDGVQVLQADGEHGVVHRVDPLARHETGRVRELQHVRRQCGVQHYLLRDDVYGGPGVVAKPLELQDVLGEGGKSVHVPYYLLLDPGRHLGGPWGVY